MDKKIYIKELLIYLNDEVEKATDSVLNSNNTNMNYYEGYRLAYKDLIRVIKNGYFYEE